MSLEVSDAHLGVLEIFVQIVDLRLHLLADFIAVFLGGLCLRSTLSNLHTKSKFSVNQSFTQKLFGYIKIPKINEK